MRSAKDLIDKQIISVNEGLIVGKVREVYFDRDARHLAAVQVAYEGLLDRTRRFIPRADIHLIGGDVVLVKRADVVRELAESDAEAWVRRDKLTGREIVTGGETRVAAIDDVILGAETVDSSTGARVTGRGVRLERRSHGYVRFSRSASALSSSPSACFSMNAAMSSRRSF